MWSRGEREGRRRRASAKPRAARARSWGGERRGGCEDASEATTFGGKGNEFFNETSRSIWVLLLCGVLRIVSATRPREWGVGWEKRRRERGIYFRTPPTAAREPKEKKKSASDGVVCCMHVRACVVCVFISSRGATDGRPPHVRPRSRSAERQPASERERERQRARARAESKKRARVPPSSPCPCTAARRTAPARTRP